VPQHVPVLKTTCVTGFSRTLPWICSHTAACYPLQVLTSQPWYVARAYKLMMPGRYKAMDMVGKLVWEHDLQVGLVQC
jgi:hypothetical protein